MAKKKGTVGKFISDAVETILILLLIFIALNVFLGQLLVITGNSMVPTLQDQEQIIGEKASINFVDLKRGEIIIFKHPKEPGLIIKRIIGMPGDKISLIDGYVHINGVKLDEPYLKEPKTEPGAFISEEEIEIPQGNYIVMGDNRSYSIDSRVWGFLPKEDITARAALVYYPIENLRIIRGSY
jgi:signal peptidase I